MMISVHDKCTNCGECCGPVPITIFEYNLITNFVQKYKPKYNKLDDKYTCKFRVDNRCSIYSVRPIICRLMGVTDALQCKNGNSANIDGMKHMNIAMKSELKGLINDVIIIDY